MGGGSPQKQTQSTNTNSTSMPLIENPAVKGLIDSTASGVAAQQAAMPLSGFNAANPMKVAPTTELQNWGADLIPSLVNTPGASATAQDYATRAPALAGRVATGANIENDPAIKAQIANYYANTVPEMENYYAKAGLGRSSSLGAGMTKGLAAMLPELYAGNLNREQGALNNEAQTMLSSSGLLSSLGGQESQRLQEAINQSQAVGGTQQQTEQAGYTAEQQDFLRRQALAEEALYTPFNQLVPSGSIGQMTTGVSNSTGTVAKQGGMFK